MVVFLVRDLTLLEGSYDSGKAWKIYIFEKKWGKAGKVMELL